jgi:hypothetical protein
MLYFNYPELMDMHEAYLEDVLAFEARPGLQFFYRRCFDFDLRFSRVKADTLGSDPRAVVVQKIGPGKVSRAIITLKSHWDDGSFSFVIHGGFDGTLMSELDARRLYKLHGGQLIPKEPFKLRGIGGIFSKGMYEQ